MTLQDVQVTIDLQKPTGRVSFAMPLILGKTTAGSDYKEYGDLESVKKDFGADTPETKMAEAIFAQGDHAPARIAMVASGENGDPVETLRQVMDRGWYYLLAGDAAPATVDALAAAIEQDDYRVFVTRVADKARLQALHAKAYTRTVAFYHNDDTLYPDAALVGSTGSYDVGSVTWKFKTCAGITAMPVSATELMEIHDNGGITYVNKQGEARTSEGKTLSGEYIDVIMSRDYVRARMEAEIQHLLNQSDKVPYTNAGIAQIESTVVNVLQEAFRQGIIAEDDSGEPLFGTSFLLRNEVEPADRASRHYKGGSFWFEIAGAVHTVRVKGVIRF
ncbi:DUF3383 family protein [Paenibacillus aquistagni]|uniref:DUF3383 family protein n=1 Tax=Paenibacillus aquistagni TaxID=1852522 RepID=UPI00145BD468|nr:DUF3383 family protein [Paenibacillus aquistagni]NMM53525.1 DUF3383 domain-containing protein [Paenibacillus aquistagni]